MDLPSSGLQAARRCWVAAVWRKRVFNTLRHGAVLYLTQESARCIFVRIKR